MKDNSRCTNPRLGRLIAAYELGLLEEAERKQFVSHLIECFHCHNELYSMAPLMGVLRARREAALSRRQRQAVAVAAAVGQSVWKQRIFLAAASIILATGAIIVVLLLRDSSLPPSPTPPIARTPVSWEKLVVPKADYVPPRLDLLRGGDATALFNRAIKNYENGNYGIAAQQFEGVVRLQPDNSSAYFYWGVALLLADRSAQAIAPLEKAVDLEGGSLRDRARYYLALAYLKTRQLDRARAQLEAILQNTCPYRVHAEELLRQLREQ